MLQAGIPNLTGSLQLTNSSTFWGDGVTGAFYPEAPTAWRNMVSNEGSNQYNRVILDASLFNPIYGRSETVQPPAFSLIPQIKY